MREPSEGGPGRARRSDQGAGARRGRTQDRHDLHRQRLRRPRGTVRRVRGHSARQRLRRRQTRRGTHAVGGIGPGDRVAREPGLRARSAPYGQLAQLLRTVRTAVAAGGDRTGPGRPVGHTGSGGRCGSGHPRRRDGARTRTAAPRRPGAAVPRPLGPASSPSGWGSPAERVSPVPKASSRYASRPENTCLSSALLASAPATRGIRVRGAREGVRVLLPETGSGRANGIPC